MAFFVKHTQKNYATVFRNGTRLLRIRVYSPNDDEIKRLMAVIDSFYSGRKEAIDVILEGELTHSDFPDAKNVNIVDSEISNDA